MMEIYLDELNSSISDEFDQYFKFLEYIAAGSFGTVVKAIDLETNNVVAVKVVEKSEQKKRNLSKLKQEINIFKQLKHKNIVEFLGCIETNNKLFIIMDYVKDGTLKALIDKRQLVGKYQLTRRPKFYGRGI